MTSPTFTVGQRYDGRVPVSHLDLYRLGGLEGEEPGLLDDYLTPEAISFVEWPERAVWDGQEAVRVAIKHRGRDRVASDRRPASASARVAAGPRGRRASRDNDRLRLVAVIERATSIFVVTVVESEPTRNP